MSTAHGATSYNRTFTTNGWRWLGTGNGTVARFNDTALTTFLAGGSNALLRIQSGSCPSVGCPTQFVEEQEPFLRWSRDTTWANVTGGKPGPGANVTVPVGWALLLDESPPALGSLVVLGSLRFDPLQDITLTAAAVMVLAGVSDVPVVAPWGLGAFGQRRNHLACVTMFSVSCLRPFCV